MKDTMLEPMMNYLVENFYPTIAQSFSTEQASMRARVMYEELVKSTALMAATW